MKLRPVRITVSDHAVLRYLERYCDVDIRAIRARLRELGTKGAVHGALAVKIDGVRLVMREQPPSVDDGVADVTVTTVLPARSGTYVE